MQKLVLDENGNEVVKQAASAGKLVLDENGNEVVKADAYQSIPNPTGQPLGADIPNINQGMFSYGQLDPGPEFNTRSRTLPLEVAKEAGKNTVQMAADLGPALAGGALGLLGGPFAPITVPLGAAAGELAKQGVKSYMGEGENSTEDNVVAAMTAGLGAVAPLAYKGAKAIDRKLATRATGKGDIAAKEADLERKLLRTQEAGREEIIAARDTATTETLAEKLKTANARMSARKTMKQELDATKQAAEEAKKAAGMTAAPGGSALAPVFGPSSNFPRATGGLIERSKSLVKSGIDDLYGEFRANPASQELFDISEIKGLASEVETASAANVPPILRQIIDGPDEVPLAMAEDFLSELKFASRIRAVGRTKSQGMAARIQNELQPQIEHALESQGEAGEAALRALRGGRALRRHFGKTFEDEVAPGVAKVLRQGGNPMQIVQNPVKLKSFVEQAGDEGLPILRRKLFDDAFGKAVNPQTGEFSAENFAKSFNKFRHALTPEQQALGDSMATGNSSQLLALDKATAQELTAVRNAHQDLNNSIGAGQMTKKAGQTIKTRKDVFESGKKTRAERLEMRIEGEREMGTMRDKLKRRGKLLLIGAAVAGASGASLVAARMRALRGMFDVLSSNH